MLSRQMQFVDEKEALFIEQAQAMYRELCDQARNAPDGQVVDVAESIAIARGRELTRRAIEQVVQREIEEAQKKGRRREPAAAAARDIIAEAVRVTFSRLAVR